MRRDTDRVPSLCVLRLPRALVFENPLLLLGLLFIVMYFTMIRPQTQQAKRHRELVGSLEKGDRIVTVGGIHGTIRSVDDKTILVEVDGGTKIRLDKGKVGYKPAASTPPTD